MNIDYKGICDLITKAYLCKEPLVDEIDEDWKRLKDHMEHRTPYEIFWAGHCSGQNTGLYRIIERINQLRKI